LSRLHGWKHSDAEVTWFWRALRSFSQEEKAKFLMFVTSSSRVPLGGFTQLQGSSGIQPFQIHKVRGIVFAMERFQLIQSPATLQLYRENVLPSAATCFNELLLPSFPSYEDLRHKLLTAISEGAGHFGLA
jgi:E3 ubiquitin-protein ligase HUWE1